MYQTISNAIKDAGYVPRHEEQIGGGAILKKITTPSGDLVAIQLKVDPSTDLLAISDPSVVKGYVQAALKREGKLDEVTGRATEEVDYAEMVKGEKRCDAVFPRSQHRRFIHLKSLDWIAKQLGISTPGFADHDHGKPSDSAGSTDC